MESDELSQVRSQACARVEDIQNNITSLRSSMKAELGGTYFQQQVLDILDQMADTLEDILISV